jgi:hypothetical protein
MWVAKFLRDRFGFTPVEVARVTPGGIVNFMVQSTNGYKPGTIRVLGCTLRSYLRFRSLSCGDDVKALVAAVPTVAQWRLDTVPAHLTSEKVAALLGAFDRQSATGQRSYAMARCLLDMGLRTGEVASIQVDDLNWRAGTPTIGRDAHALRRCKPERDCRRLAPSQSGYDDNLQQGGLAKTGISGCALARRSVMKQAPTMVSMDRLLRRRTAAEFGP